MRLLKLVPDNTNIGFVALRKWAFALTTLLTVAAVGAGRSRAGLNLGVDFVGGLMIEEQVRDRAAARQAARDGRPARRRRGLAAAVRRSPRRSRSACRCPKSDRRGRDQRGGRRRSRPRSRPSSPARRFTKLRHGLGQGFGRADPERHARGGARDARHRACSRSSASNGSSASRPSSRSSTTC